jgi:hypothetical protein
LKSDSNSVEFSAMHDSDAPVLQRFAAQHLLQQTIGRSGTTLSCFKNKSWPPCGLYVYNRTTATQRLMVCASWPFSLSEPAPA